MGHTGGAQITCHSEMIFVTHGGTPVHRTRPALSRVGGYYVKHHQLSERYVALLPDGGGCSEVNHDFADDPRGIPGSHKSTGHNRLLVDGNRHHAARKHRVVVIIVAACS